MDAVTGAIILQSLDGLSARMVATAQNIANANSPGYRPLRVSFEDALRRAAPLGVDALRAVAPRVATTTDSEGRGALRLDLELATATSTSGRYQTMVELLNRMLQIEAVALSGGR